MTIEIAMTAIAVALIATTATAAAMAYRISRPPSGKAL